MSKGLYKHIFLLFAWSIASLITSTIISGCWLMLGIDGIIREYARMWNMDSYGAIFSIIWCEIPHYIVVFGGVIITINKYRKSKIMAWLCWSIYVIFGLLLSFITLHPAGTGWHIQMMVSVMILTSAIPAQMGIWFCSRKE